MARSAVLYVVVALVVAAIALATTYASFFYTEEDLVLDDSVWAREHGDKTRHFPIFKNNARWIRDKYGNKEGKYAINIFGDDMTYEEVITLAMGLREIETKMWHIAFLGQGSM